MVCIFVSRFLSISIEGSHCTTSYSFFKVFAHSMCTSALWNLAVKLLMHAGMKHCFCSSILHAFLGGKL